MKIRVHVSDERGTDSIQEFALREDDPAGLQKKLEEAITFLRKEALALLRRGEAASQPEALYADRPPRLSGLTLMEMLQGFLEADYADAWFTSIQVHHAFRQAHGSISLSTVSTYLSRLHRAGVLERGGNRRRWTYRVAHGPGTAGAREVSLL